MPDRPRVLVALSGGVDSSVAAHLLIQQGFACVGAIMRLSGTGDAGGDAPDADVEDARAVAARLGIPLHVLDCRDAFDAEIVEEFVRAYERGVTPNPCVICNRRIKFGLLLDHARALGCDLIATGHYARLRTRAGAGGGTVYELAKAADPAKDQSYFLYSLTQEVLAHVRFPLGDLTKEGDVRRIAAELGLPTARKRESQGICFVPRNDVASFIEARRGRPLEPGPVIDRAGAVIGQHQGAIRYTIGQRKGIGVAAGQPRYVTAIDAGANTVTLGDEADLLASSLIATDWIWSAPADAMERKLAAAGPAGLPVAAQIRYHQPDQAARVRRLDAGTLRLDFDRPQRAIAPGQAVVLYAGDVVLGGGTVLRAETPAL